MCELIIELGEKLNAKDLDKKFDDGEDISEYLINANGCNEDMSHLMEYNISIPKHLPEPEDFMKYMVVSWGVIIIGIVLLGLFI
jgi:hypothetical protein